MAGDNEVLENGTEMFPSKLKQLLEEKGMSQADLARRLGTTRQSVAGYCNGQTRVIPYDKLVAIAKICGVSTDYLLTDTKTKSPDYSMQTACALTGLSEDSIHMLNSTPAGPVINYLLHTGDGSLWQDLSGYLDSSLQEEDCYLEVDARSTEIKKAAEDSGSRQPNVYKVKNSEIVERVLLGRITASLRQYRRDYRKWASENSPR